MKTDNLTQQESLDLIAKMIGEAKHSIAKGGSFYFLLWGFTMAAANFGHYGLEHIGYEMPYLIWLITLPVVAVSIVYGMRQDIRMGVRSHFDKIYGQIWLAIGIGMICTLVFMFKINFNHNAVILLMAAIGTYISGSMLRFGPLIFGGLLLFAAGCIAFTQTPHDQNLVAGIAIILGYIVPGFLLKRQERE